MRKLWEVCANEYLDALFYPICIERTSSVSRYGRRVIYRVCVMCFCRVSSERESVTAIDRVLFCGCFGVRVKVRCV